MRRSELHQGVFSSVQPYARARRERGEQDERAAEQLDDFSPHRDDFSLIFCHDDSECWSRSYAPMNRTVSANRISTSL